MLYWRLVKQTQTRSMAAQVNTLIETGSAETIFKGSVFEYKRIYRNGVINLKNVGIGNTDVLVRWKTSDGQEPKDSEFSLLLAADSSIEFEVPCGSDASLFLDFIGIELKAGGPVEISCSAPTEHFN